MADKEIQIIRQPIDPSQLEPLAAAWFGTMIKGVVDLEREVAALGGDWHMDANVVLIADGSEQQNVWGFNLYPDERGGPAIEYISLINIRPGQGNRGMELEDEQLRDRVRAILSHLVPHLEL